MRSLRVALLGLAFLAFAIVLVAGSAEATHYRSGSLQWSSTNATNEALFTGSQGWRWSAFGSPAVGDVIPAEGRIATGDGKMLPFHLKVESVNTDNDWFVGRIVDVAGNEGVRHRYAAPNNGGAPWVASWGGCCRVSQMASGTFHANNADQPQRLETLVDLTTPNRSPVVSMPPINPCVLGGLCTIQISATDDEAITYRLATPQEAGAAAFHPPGAPEAPHAATLSGAGVLTWDTDGARFEAGMHTLYSVQVMVEDGRTKTPVEFFIELFPEALDPPYWIMPPTPCGATLSTGASQLLSFDVSATSDAPSRKITLSAVGLPSGASFPIPPAANAAQSTFSWQPTAAHLGTYLIAFTGMDDHGALTPPCDVTLIVYPGDFNAHGVGVTLLDGASGQRGPVAHVGQGNARAVQIADAGVARIDAAEFAFAGDARFRADGTFHGFATAATLAGVVEVPGLLRAEGVWSQVSSVVDAQGAESNGDVRFTRLVIAGEEIELGVGGFSGPREFRVPGVATIRLHEMMDSGDGVRNARATLHAIHVIFVGQDKELFLVSATAEVGVDVLRQEPPGETIGVRPPAARASAPMTVPATRSARAARADILPGGDA